MSKRGNFPRHCNKPMQVKQQEESTYTLLTCSSCGKKIRGDR